MTTKLALIGCGAAKEPGVLPAKDKYSSNYFNLKWDYGDVVCDKQRIVSAKYGLIEPDEEIDDYDVTVRDMNAEDRENWGARVGRELTSTVTSFELDEDELPVEIHLLLGSAYQEPIMEDLLWLEAQGCELVYPFEDTSGIGEQMSVLKERTQDARAEQ